MKIKTLNQETINQIAAGEVILRPSSVLKELIENSLDAGSTRIDIKIEKGGKKLIRVTDNGCGIAYNEVPLAFKRHATSKLRDISDLDRLNTMGFRGEALSSIVSVADVTILTRADDEEMGSKTVFSEGKMVSREAIPYAKGTEIIVENLFQYVPARYKFLKTDRTEERASRELIEKLILSKPEIAFSYQIDKRKKVVTSGNGNLKEAAAKLYGTSFIDHFKEFEIENSPIKVHGLIGDLEARRENRKNQIFFINNRFVKSRELTQAFEDEWYGKLMKNQYPSGIIFLDINPDMIDVNIHPQKTQIRLLNKSLITLLFKQSIRDVLGNTDLINESHIDEETIYKFPSQEDVEQSSFLEADVKSFYEKYPEARSQKKEEPLEQTSLLLTRETENKVEKVPLPVFSNLNYVGQLFNTYILLAGKKDLYVVDQHAAHEAILFDEYKEVFEGNKSFSSQLLLINPKIPLTNDEIEIFENNRERLKQFGFDGSIKDGVLTVTSVPIILNRNEDHNIILKLLSSLSKETLLDSEIENIATMSCKNAIKAGFELNEEEIFVLLERLQNIKNPYTCPHGRPILIKITEYELEKLFKRVI